MFSKHVVKKKIGAKKKEKPFVSRKKKERNVNWGVSERTLKNRQISVARMTLTEQSI